MKGIKKQKKLLHVFCASTMLVGTSVVSVPLYATQIQAEDRQEQIRQVDDVKLVLCQENGEIKPRNSIN